MPQALEGGCPWRCMVWGAIGIGGGGVGMYSHWMNNYAWNTLDGLRAVMVGSSIHTGLQGDSLHGVPTRYSAWIFIRGSRLGQGMGCKWNPLPLFKNERGSYTPYTPKSGYKRQGILVSLLFILHL